MAAGEIQHTDASDAAGLREGLLAALAEIADTAELVARPSALCARALEAALAGTGAEGGALWFGGAAGSRWRVAASAGPARAAPGRPPCGAEILSEVASTRRARCLRASMDLPGPAPSVPRALLASALVAPLLHDERLVGALCLYDTRETTRFGDADLPFADALGRALGPLVARARATAAARREHARLATVERARRILAGGGQPPERLAALCRLAAECAGAGTATLWLRHADEETFALAATSGPGGALGGGARLEPGRGIDGRAARDRLAICLHRQGRLAYAAIPLVADGTALGVLAVQAGDGSADRARLEALAAAAAAELARRARAERAAARVVRLEALHEAGLRLLALDDPDRVAQAAAAEAAWLLESAHAVVRLREPGTPRFAARGVAGLEADPERDALLALDRELCRQAAAAGARIARRADADAGSPAALVLPLRGRGGVLGTLGVYGRSAGSEHAADFDGEDSALLEGLARSAAHALAAATRPPPAPPREAPGLEARLDALLASSDADPFALLAVWADNADELAGAGRLDAALRRIDEGVRAHLGARDRAERRGARWLVLLPSAGPAPAERVAQLARALAEHVAKGAEHDGPARVVLAFGYAVHPGEGDARGTLLARAQAPRIRML